MNRLIMIYGCVLLSSSAIAATQESIWEATPIMETLQDKGTYKNLITAVDHKTVNLEVFSHPSNTSDDESYDLDISKIEYIEDETIELGFNPYDYLPKNFNPYSSFFDLNSVAFIDGEVNSLDFDTEKYLPTDFDAFKETTALSSFYFIEEEDIALGFDAGEYLPNGFSPYESYFDLNSINYIEIDGLEDDFLTPPNIGCIVDEPLN